MNEPVICPACGEEGLLHKQSSMDIPHFGEVMISSLLCRTCGYRHNDVIPLENREPVRMWCKILCERDLGIRVIRSSTTTYKIPELGVEVDPGIASEGFISNVEGILLRIRDITNQMTRDLEIHLGEEPSIKERYDRSLEVSDEIARALNGYDDDQEKNGLTLILEDQNGNCGLVSERDNVFSEPLKDDETDDLKSVKRDLPDA